MKISLIFEDDLSDPDHEGEDEEAVVFNYEDIDEKLFDMNFKGLYLYPVYYIKFIDPLCPRSNPGELKKLEVIGIDII